MKKIGITLYMLMIGFLLIGQSHGKEFDLIETTADLREAIDEADDNGEDDVIILGEGTFEIDKTLTFIRHDGKSITFQGAGKDKTLLDGGGSVQIMVIRSVSSDETGSHTIVKELTFQNGYSDYDINASENDFSKGSGGGLYIHTGNSDLIVEDVKFIGNKTNLREPSGGSILKHTNYGGGGLHAIGPGARKDHLRGKIINCEFENNESTNGGGLYVSDMDIVSGCKFVNNKASINGGGLFSGGRIHITIENSDFTGNRSDLRIHDEGSRMLGGGAMALAPGTRGTATIMNCRLDNNHSRSTGGGALFFNMNGIHVISSRFTNNGAIGNGGGLCAQGDLRAYNNIFDQNQSNASGGGLWLQAPNPRVINNTLVRNTARQKGGAVYVAAQRETLIYNNVFWENNLDANGNGRDLYHGKHGNLNTHYLETHLHNNILDIENGAVIPEEGERTLQDNQLEDPNMRMDDGSYAVEAGSKCIDTGTNEALQDDVWHSHEEDEQIQTDFNGNKRVANHVIDRGAVEYGAEVVNSPPTAENQTITIAEDTVDHPITLNGSDENGDALTFTVSQGPSNGDWSGDLPNLSYTPKADYYGEDRILFIVSDGDKTATGRIDITITPVQDPPVAVDRSVVIKIDATDTPIDCSGSDPDPDDVLAYEISKAPLHGQLTQAIPNVCRYTPNPGYEGTDEFEFTVDDGNGSPATAKVTIMVTSIEIAGHPMAEDIEVTVNKDSRDNAIMCTGADSDNDPLTYTLTSAPSHGTIDTTEMPNLRYTPNSDFTGTDTFTYTVTDDDHNAATGTVTITVEEEIGTGGDSGGDSGGGGGGCFIQQLSPL